MEDFANLDYILIQANVFVFNTVEETLKLGFPIYYTAFQQKSERLSIGLSSEALCFKEGMK